MAGLVERALDRRVFAALRQMVEGRQALVFLGELRAPGADVDEWHRRYDGAVPNAARSDAVVLHDLVSDIAALPPPERLALTLHYLECLSNAEIGELLGVDVPSAVRPRRNALRRIAKA
jgi:DNA-directed RNA polymerase specialized sigma24 family protein